MTLLQWREPGTRLYNSGVDRVVLYIPGEDGVAWSGVVSIDERSTGGDPNPYYIDGYKYLNLAAQEEFEAVLSAYYSPPEFDQCDGTLEVAPGLLATQQVRRPFGLTYRTGLGSDLSPRHGYKIHLVYNALAAPTSTPHKTESDNPGVDPISWSLTTQPIFVDGVHPTAHFVVDTTKAPPWFVSHLEFLLYGHRTRPPSLPHPDGLRELQPGVYGEALYDISFYA